MFRIENLTKQFSGNFVLSNFSFEINAGDKINIVGRSGIGKTTLFRLLLGFDKPDSGKIFYREKPLTDALSWQVRRQVAYVSQDLNIGRGVVRNFFGETMALKANRQAETHALAQLENYFDYFDLALTLLDKRIEELSGGEKQRIAIINAILLNRSVFFLDEISSSLDAALKEKTMRFFLTKPQFTVLYVSHDQIEIPDTRVRKLMLD